MKNNFISVGKILNFHGVQGEAKLGYSKNREEFISKLKQVYVLVDNDYKALEVTRIRFTPKCGIIKFKGINTLNDILPYKNQILYYNILIYFFYSFLLYYYIILLFLCFLYYNTICIHIIFFNIILILFILIARFFTLYYR